MTIRHIHTNLQIRIRNSELCKCCHTISVAVGKRERDSRRVSTTTGFLNVSQIAYVFPRVVAESAAAQATTPATPRSYVIHAAHMIDGRSDVVQNDVAVIVEGANERIHGDARSRNRGRLVRRRRCEDGYRTRCYSGAAHVRLNEELQLKTTGRGLWAGRLGASG